MDSKELIAFELGYRIQPYDHLTFDLATFYNIYDRQRSLEPGTPFVKPALHRLTLSSPTQLTI